MDYAIITSVSKLQNQFYITFKPLIGFGDEIMKRLGLVQLGGEYAVLNTTKLTAEIKAGNVFSDVTFIPMNENTQRMQRNYDLDGNLIGNIAKPKANIQFGVDSKFVGSIELAEIIDDETEDITEPVADKQKAK